MGERLLGVLALSSGPSKEDLTLYGSALWIIFPLTKLFQSYVCVKVKLQKTDNYANDSCC